MVEVTERVRTSVGGGSPPRDALSPTVGWPLIRDMRVISTLMPIEQETLIGDMWVTDRAEVDAFFTDDRTRVWV